MAIPIICARHKQQCGQSVIVSELSPTRRHPTWPGTARHFASCLANTANATETEIDSLCCSSPQMPDDGARTVVSVDAFAAIAVSARVIPLPASMQPLTALGYACISVGSTGSQRLRTVVRGEYDLITICDQAGANTLDDMGWRITENQQRRPHRIVKDEAQAILGRPSLVPQLSKLGTSRPVQWDRWFGRTA